MLPSTAAWCARACRYAESSMQLSCCRCRWAERCASRWGAPWRHSGATPGVVSSMLQCTTSEWSLHAACMFRHTAQSAPKSSGVLTGRTLGDHVAVHEQEDEEQEPGKGVGHDEGAANRTHDSEQAHCQLVAQEHEEPEAEQPAPQPRRLSSGAARMTSAACVPRQMCRLHFVALP